MGAVIDAFPPDFFLLLREMGGLLAGFAATAFIPGSAVGTLDKQEVTAFVTAVGMCVGRPAALVTTGNDLLADAFPQAVVEDEILPPELVFQPFFLYGIGVMDDASFQVKDIVKPFMQEIGAGFFTADASRT